MQEPGISHHFDNNYQENSSDLVSFQESFCVALFGHLRIKSELWF